MAVWYMPVECEAREVVDDESTGGAFPLQAGLSPSVQRSGFRGSNCHLWLSEGCLGSDIFILHGASRNAMIM